MSGSMLSEVDRLLYNLKLHMPQFEMDGYKNIWIVKPGAKSRGRGKLDKDWTCPKVPKI